MSGGLKPSSNGLCAAWAPRFELQARFARGVLEARSEELSRLLVRLEPFARARVLFLLDAGLVRARPELARAASAYARARRGSLAEAAAPVVVDAAGADAARPQLADWLRARLRAAALGPRGHVVAVGGGALLGAASFAAATLDDGALRVTRVPTTFSAQVESCLSLRARLGGAGAFAPPFGVVIDVGLLDAADERRRSSGLARVARAALARDPELFHWLCDRAAALRAGDPDLLETAARWSLRLELARVGEPAACRAWPEPSEPFAERLAEQARRAGGGRLLRGEALAAALAAVVSLSRELCGLPDAACDAALALLRRLGLPLWDPAFEEARPFEGAAPICLLRQIGETLELESVDEAAAARAVQRLRSRPRRHS